MSLRREELAGHPRLTPRNQDPSASGKRWMEQGTGMREVQVVVLGKCSV
jgi:hypothetical protein